jgi:hypothetical protein
MRPPPGARIAGETTWSRSTSTAAGNPVLTIAAAGLASTALVAVTTAPQTMVRGRATRAPSIA